SEFLRGALVIRGRTGVNLLSAVGRLTMRNTRRYGGYVVHFGMVLVFIGLFGAAFNRDKQMEMAPGSRIEIGADTLVFQTFTTRPAQNYTAERATIEVLRGSRQVMMLYPERRFYPANEQAGTMVSIFSTLREDLYVVYAGRSPESDQPVIHAYLNPLVKWIWLGGVIVVLGTGLALLPDRQMGLAARARAQKVLPVAAAKPVSASAGSYGQERRERNPTL